MNRAVLSRGSINAVSIKREASLVPPATPAGAPDPIKGRSARVDVRRHRPRNIMLLSCLAQAAVAVSINNDDGLDQ